MIARVQLVLLLSLGVLAQSAPRPATAVHQGFTIAGVAVNSVTGQPLTGISVLLAPSGEHATPQTVLTAADGRFSFAVLARGNYSLTGTGPGFRSQALDQHDNFFTGVVVGPELDTQHIVFRMQPDALIEGRVTDDETDPVRNATVQLFSRDLSSGRQRTLPIANASTDDQGSYRLGHLAPGTYYVAVSARPWYAQYNPQRLQGVDPEVAALAAQESAQLDVAYPLTFYPDSDDSSRASPIVLRAGDHVAADIVMRAVPSAHLRIRSSPGRVPGFPRLSLRVFEGYLNPVASSQGMAPSPGVYEFDGLAPGHYVLEMPQGEPNGKAASSAGWYQEIDLAGDTEIQADAAPALATITGLLSYEGAPPTEKMYVQLQNRDTGENWVGEVSKKGLFGLKDNQVRPGTYDVTVFGAANWYTWRLVAKGAKVAGQTVTIPPSAAVELVCTATRTTAAVKGTALLDDKPSSGIKVLLVPRDPENDWLLFRQDQSDSDGTFTFRDVLPGQYTAIALQNGWDVEWADPAALRPFLASGVPVTVSADSKLNIKLHVK